MWTKLFVFLPILASAQLPVTDMSPEAAAQRSLLPDSAKPETPQPQASRPFGRIGLGLKSGEAAGAMGIQVAWNFNRQFQACAGAGGMTDLDLDLLFPRDRSRTDSYYLLGKYFWDHIYLSTGYSMKISKIEMELPGGVFTAKKSESGIPFHLGYEFGHREGFFFSTSIGYLYVIGGGNRNVAQDTGTAQGTLLASSKNRTVRSGPSLGISIGYYMW